MITSLPQPGTAEQSHSEQLLTLIREEIDKAGGAIDFAHYMQLALYAPGLGYYSAGARKFGHAGDFVTAPEISALFAQSLAGQVAELLQPAQPDVLELGAGSGRLALELLLELQRQEHLPQHYYILEVSAYLRQLQQETLKQALPEALRARVIWLDTLPASFSGVVLANEVLDALPVHLIRAGDAGLQQMGVTWQQDGLAWMELALAQGLLQERADSLKLVPPYQTEICPAAAGLVSSLAGLLQQGVLLFIDYGFPRREYYHAQRGQGTLMCHYRHYAHDDPLRYPGLQDITAHVDFTAIAEAGMANGLQMLGYCGQAQFLINCGITRHLANVSPQDVAAYMPLAAQAQKLLSPAEMGELFKVIALGKGVGPPLLGFQSGDKSHTLWRAE